MIAKVLPKLISNNQVGFVKGKSISKNMILAQEIIQDMRLMSKWHNVEVKLDMDKAYDRAS